MHRSALLVVFVAGTALLSMALIGHFGSQKRIESIPAHIEAAFETWQSQYSRLYSSPAERKFRLEVFYKNYLKIKAIETMSVSFKVGLNKFADVSEEEYRSKYLTLKEPSDWKVDESKVFKPKTDN